MAGSADPSPSRKEPRAAATAPTKAIDNTRPNDSTDNGIDEAAAKANNTNEPGSPGNGLNRIYRVDLKPASTEPNEIKMNVSDKIKQALNLPVIMNVNPRSIYNKVEDFHTFVDVQGIDCVFMSESWERPEQPLEDIINLPDHTIISNPHQRKGQGGRPALIINHKKYIIKNITQSLINIPWGN